MFQVVEQNFDIPCRGGVGRRGGLHGSLRRDLALLGQARHRTAMEVHSCCASLVRRGVALTSYEHALAVGHRSPGRYTNTGYRAEGARADPGVDRGRGDSGG